MGDTKHVVFQWKHLAFLTEYGAGVGVCVADDNDAGIASLVSFEAPMPSVPEGALVAAVDTAAGLCLFRAKVLRRDARKSENAEAVAGLREVAARLLALAAEIDAGTVKIPKSLEE